ncbi:MAG: SpoIIE family protein phosphatase [Caulobacteraceae bacterium]|nr:SpoIIE family protein phosphatase [Caulobacteraceae bacterium]
MSASAVEAPTAQLGHFLTFTQDGLLRRLRIGPQGVTVGREAECDIQLPVPEVSRRHCHIQVEGEGAIARDLGSTNGTFLSGERIAAPVRLRNGAHLTIGPAVLRYEQRDERETEAEARLTTELREAVEYVRALLPEPIISGPVQTEWWYVPSSELGGDAFGYQYIDDRTLVGFLLDVTGHGIGAGMHAANIVNVLRRRALPGVDFHDPGQVAAGLNAMFPMEEHGGFMFTLWCFSYDIVERTLRYCAAGHHPSYLVTPDTPEPQDLWQRAPSIGMLPPRPWPSGETRIPRNSHLYIFSDGAFEIVDAKGEEWRMENLRQIIGQHGNRSAGEAQRLYRAVRDAAQPGPLGDDFSVLVLHFS